MFSYFQYGLLCFKISVFFFLISVIFKIVMVLTQFHTQATKCHKIPTLKVRESFGNHYVLVLFQRDKI